MKANRLPALVALTATALVPAIAEACPYCAAQAGIGTRGVALALGGFLLLPFAVVATIVRIIRSERGPTG